MRYLHTMVRVHNLEASLRFYVQALGMVEVRRMESEKGRFTNIFLAAPEDLPGAGHSDDHRGAPQLELTYNWPDEDGNIEDYTGGRNFGHLAFEVDDIYAICQRLMGMGILIHRPPRDGNMAFVRSPDLISVEILQKGAALAPAEPWISMPNTGVW